jgi:O-antigen/teichoic acid export membrane protein
MDCIARSLIFRNILSVSLAAGILYSTANLVYTALGLLVGRSVTLLLYDFKADELERSITAQRSAGLVGFFNSYTVHFAPLFKRKLQWEMLWIAFPLGIVSVLVSLNGNMPRYVIDKYLGPHDLGIFSALGYIPQAAVLAASTLGNVAFARLSRSFFATDLRGFKKLLKQLIFIALALGMSALLISIVAGRQILSVLYRPEYAEHFALFLWLVGAAVLACVATTVGCAITAASEFRSQVPLFAIVTTTSAVVAVILVPRLGLYGAAIASLTAMIVQLLGACLILRHALASCINRTSDIQRSVELVDTLTQV